MKKSLFATAYFAPAIQYSEYLKADKIYTEIHEHFPKQTYRNRTYIMTANGIFALSIPLAGRKNHSLTKDIKISQAEDWQKLHWKTIENAYQRSPFFEYYDSKVAELYTKSKHTYLIDFNNEAESIISEILKVELSKENTKTFVPENDESYRDLRLITPKNRELPELITENSYLQVFADKYPFEPNLSILDVIFNLGPESVSHLKQMDILI
tara:strand:+ start:3402 stop:4034 length:633 start_codon:yes stop_codon:yes gene_type:complete